MTCMASSGAFGHFTFTAFSAKNIPVVVGVIISPSLIDFSMFFSNQNYSFMCSVFSPSYCKAYYSALVVEGSLLFFVELFFVYSLRRFLVLCKKYTSTSPKQSNYTNAINISITGSCDKVIYRGTGKRSRIICRRRGRRSRVIRRGRGSKLITAKYI